MNKYITIKSWITNFKTFFILYILLIVSLGLDAQNVIEKTIESKGIETILLNGNQIFEIAISTTTNDYITVTSTLDGEYQNQFQIIARQVDNQLELRLVQFEFTTIIDDKRNAHKVIAATLDIKIPNGLNIDILSDIGSVDLEGNFKSITIELLQGHCTVKGESKDTTINTIDGDINVVTKSAAINAKSNHGNVVLDNFPESNSIWQLRSINGDIAVAKQD